MDSTGFPHDLFSLPALQSNGLAYPHLFRRYVERAFAGCVTDEERRFVGNLVKRLIVANQHGRRDTDWDAQELMPSYLWDARRAEQTAQREESQRASERHEAQETERLRAVAAAEAAAAAAERVRVDIAAAERARVDIAAAERVNGFPFAVLK